MLFLFVGCQADPAALLTPPRTEAHSALLSRQGSEILLGTASYLMPESGDLTGSAGEMDFDGDGTPEIVSCLMRKGHPTVEVYRQTDGEQTLLARITGEGSGIRTLYFPKLDEAGTMGIVVSWMMDASSLHGITVCAYFDGRFETLHSGWVQEVITADLDRDGSDEILYLTQNEEQLWQAVMLRYQSGGLRSLEPVSLSQGLELQNVLVANIGFDRTALLCEGYVEHVGTVTDVIVCSDGQLKNIYLSELTGVSDATARDIPLFAADVNNDGTVEIPRARMVTEVVDSGETAADAMLIDWYRCDEFSDPIDLYTTYHHPDEGWFFRLPDRMRFSVLPVQGVESTYASSTMFYFLSGEGQRGKALWEVYVLSGDDAEKTEAVCALRRLAAADGCLYALRHHGTVETYYTHNSLPQYFSLIETDTAGMQIAIRSSSQDGGTP